MCSCRSGTEDLIRPSSTRSIRGEGETLYMGWMRDRLWFSLVIARCTDTVEMGVPYRGSRDVKSFLLAFLGEVS